MIPTAWGRTLLVCACLFPLTALVRAEDPQPTVAGTVTAIKQATQVVDLWTIEPPSWIGTNEVERDTSGSTGPLVAGRPVIRLGHVAKPQLHVYPAEPGSVFASTMIIICPGGGYSILAWDLEGTEIAERFNRLGFSAAVVKYRVPTSHTDQAWLPPVQDIQRAVSMMRSEFRGEHPTYERVGVVGFSAGGNAAARVATASGKRFYEPSDQIDQASCEVDFAGLVYPWLMVEDASKSKNTEPNLRGMIPDLEIDASTPPIFLTHAIDDPISCRNSSELFSRLQSEGVLAELHIFAGGGHGFGARDENLPIANWPTQMAAWLKTQSSAP